MRVSLNCTLILLIMLTMSASRMFSQDQATAQRIGGLFQEQKYSEARPLLEKELEKDTLLPVNLKMNYLFQLGICLNELKEYRASIEIWRTMMKNTGPHPMLLGNMGWACFLDGDVDSAISATANALALDGTQAWLFGNMGLYRLAKGELDAMATAYGKALDLAENVDTWHAMQKDLQDLCGRTAPEGCDRATGFFEERWLPFLRRLYEEGDVIKGMDLVEAHKEEYKKIAELIRKEASSAAGEEQTKKSELLKRLESDLEL